MESRVGGGWRAYRKKRKELTPEASPEASDEIKTEDKDANFKKWVAKAPGKRWRVALARALDRD